MKNILFLFLLFPVVILTAQTNPGEKVIKTKVNEVSVYFKDARVIRNKKINLPKGKSILKFVNLSPFVVPNSVQVKVKGDIMVLSVNHQKNFLDKLHKPKEVIDYENRIRSLDEQIQMKGKLLELVHEQQSFLKNNKDIGGNQKITQQDISGVYDYYEKKMKELILKELKFQKDIDKLNKEKTDLIKQLKSRIGKKDFSKSEIVVNVDAKTAGNYMFTLSYLVKNAGWFPSYDIRAKSIDKPLKIVYKANIKQDTKVDWKNVKIHLSTADINITKNAPKLKTYYVGNNTFPPVYKINKTEEESGTFTRIVSGTVTEKGNGYPMPGVIVYIKGTKMGTATDFDGKYQITLPKDKNYLEFTAHGYKPLTVPVNNSIMNVQMERDKTLNYVMIHGKKYFTKDNDIYDDTKNKDDNNYYKPVPTKQDDHQVTVDFSIDIPFSVPSDHQSHTVIISNNEVQTIYQYLSIPKITNKAYLIAQVSDWEKYNFLEGEANIFFEDTFVEKTLLNTQNNMDILKISLGTDKNVIVQRKLIKDFSKKQLIGNKKEVTKAWKIEVKNNKNKEIYIVIKDQVPVSKEKDVNVEIIEFSGGDVNKDTGTVTWKMNLSPKQKKELMLKYQVKYPKFSNVIVE